MGKRTSFVRDSVGRFARTAGEAMGKEAKKAAKQAKEDLTRSFIDGAKRELRTAAQELKRATKEWNAAKRASEIDDDDFDEIQKKYERAVAAKLKAELKLHGGQPNRQGN